MTILSNKFDSHDFTHSEKDGDGSKASSHETWLSELWHSTKYSFAQSSYDAVRQDVNHLAGMFSKDAKPMSEHQFVAPVHWRNDQSSIGIAQDVGAAIGAIPYAAAIHFGLKKLLPEMPMAKSVPLLAGDSAHQTLNVFRTAMTGGILGGVLTPVEDNADWSKNKLKSATTGLASFAVAGAGMEFLGGGQLTGKLISENKLTAGVVEGGMRRAENFAVAAVSGSAASLASTESNSMIYDHKFASADEIAKNNFKTVALMATLSALQPGFGRTMQEKTTQAKLISVKAAAQETAPPQELTSIIKTPEQTSVPRSLEQIAAGARVAEDTSIPRPIRFASPIVKNDLEAKPDINQAHRLETQAKTFADNGQFVDGARHLTVAIDCLEAAKALGDSVDQSHLTQLYRGLAEMTLRADKP